MSSFALPDFCLAITSEPPGTFSGAPNLTRSYSIHGVLSRARSLPQSVKAVVTLHYDSSLVQGTTRPVIVPLVRAKTAKKGPQPVPAWHVSIGQCTDTGSGTVSITVPLTALNGKFQFQVVSPSKSQERGGLHPPFTPKSCSATVKGHPG
jgi:hypothetical protein